MYLDLVFGNSPAVNESLASLLPSSRMLGLNERRPFHLGMACICITAHISVTLPAKLDWLIAWLEPRVDGSAVSQYLAEERWQAVLHLHCSR
jgi:hypothetical protein